MENLNLFAFKNGIYNFTTKQFDENEMEPINHCGYNFIDLNTFNLVVDVETINFINQCMNEWFGNNTDEIYTLLKNITMGNINISTMYIFYGTGCNGKSLFMWIMKQLFNNDKTMNKKLLFVEEIKIDEFNDLNNTIIVCCIKDKTSLDNTITKLKQMNIDYQIIYFSSKFTEPENLAYTILSYDEGHVYIVNKQLKDKLSNMIDIFMSFLIHFKFN